MIIIIIWLIFGICNCVFIRIKLKPEKILPMHYVDGFLFGPLAVLCYFENYSGSNWGGE